MERRNYARWIPSGQSKIELILGDCVVLEKRKSNRNPYSGKSYNIYTQPSNVGTVLVDNAAETFLLWRLKDGVRITWTTSCRSPTAPSSNVICNFSRLGPDKSANSAGSTDNGKTGT